MKPWEDREITADQLSKYVAAKGAEIREGIVFAFNPPPIRGLGQAGGLEFYLQNRADGNPKRLAQVMQEFAGNLRKRSELTGVNTLFRPTVPQVSVDVDNEKALSLGVPIGDVFDSLQSTMGALYVNDFNKFGRTYRVQVQAEAAYRATPDNLGDVYVRSATTGEMIPLKALVRSRSVVGPDQVDRFNGFVSAKMLANGVQGVSSGQAIAVVEEEAKKLPEGFYIEWAGQAYQEKRTGKASSIAFGMALVMVFLILAANYERWSLPVAVLLAVPFAILGAVGFVLLRGGSNDIYFQIGLVTLIGLAAKNSGMKSVATKVAMIMPPSTPVPMERRAAAPAPEATTSGTTPRQNASEVMTIGRKRMRAAFTAASYAESPLSISWFANSTIRIAFFAASPMRVTRPIWK
jgi:multidrug efflux pump subunit AcrB